MIKVLDPKDVPPMKKPSAFRELANQAMAAADKNNGKYISVTRDDGKNLFAANLKPYISDGYRIFQRRQMVLLIKGVA